MSWNIAIDEPKSFEMLRPQTIAQAIELGDRYRGRAAYLAGGCDLVEQLKQQWSTYHYLINLKSIPGLKGIEQKAGTTRIGALTTLGELERDAGVRMLAPGLVQAAGRVATPQIRNAGTIGGNLLQDSRCAYYRGPWHCYRAGGIVCDARHGLHREHAIFGGERCITVSPSDTAPMLVALDAVAEIASNAGARQIPLSDLFVLPKDNIRVMHRLGAGEILTAVEIPERSGASSVFIKEAIRLAWDFAIASVAIVIHREGDICRRARIVMGAVAPIPWRSTAAESEVEGKRLTADVIERAARAAVQDARPSGQTEYKVALLRKVVREALQRLA